MFRLMVVVQVAVMVTGCAHHDNRSASYQEGATVWALVVHGNSFVTWVTKEPSAPCVPQPAPTDVKWQSLAELQSYVREHWDTPKTLVVVCPLTAIDCVCSAAAILRHEDIAQAYSAALQVRDWAAVRAVVDSLPE